MLGINENLTNLFFGQIGGKKNLLCDIMLISFKEVIYYNHKNGQTFEYKGKHKLLKKAKISTLAN